MSKTNRYKKFIEYLKNNKEAEFFDSLNDIILSNESKEADEILAEVSKEHDLLKIAIKALKSGFDCFNLLEILAETTIKTEISIPELLEFLQIIYDKIINNLTRYKINEAFNNILKCNTDIIDDVKKNLQDSNLPCAKSYLAEIFLFKSKTNPIETHIELISLIKTEKDSNILSGYIGALANINYSILTSDKLDITLAAFDDLYRADNISLLSNITWAYGRMLQYSNKIVNRLLEVSHNKAIEIKNILAQILFLNTNYNSESWYNEILFSLLDVPYEECEIVSFIDSILERKLVGREIHLVTDFLEKWAINNPKNEKFEYRDLYNSTFYELLKMPNELKKILVKYFSNNNFSVVTLGCEICSFYKLHMKEGLGFDVSELKALNNDTIIYMIKMIHGCLFDFEEIFPLTISVLDRIIDDSALQQEMIEHIFLKLIGYNYPNKSLEYIKRILDSETQYKKIQYLNFIIQKIQRRKEDLEKIHKVKEIKIADRFLNDVFVARQKQINKTMNARRADSIIDMIAHKVPIKYGRSIIHSVNNIQHSGISNMVEFHVDFELPLSEITRPIDDALLRYSFRMSEKDNK